MSADQLAVRIFAVTGDEPFWVRRLGASTIHERLLSTRRLLRSRGNGWEAVDTWGDSAELRRMPYALLTLPDQPGRLLAGLRGGTLLITDDAGQTWSRLSLRLPDVIELAAPSA